MHPYDDSQDDALAGWVKLVVGLAIAFGIFMLGAIFAPPTYSHAFNCASRSELVQSLKEEYEEKPLWLGLQRRSVEGVPVQMYVELWVGEDTHTLTIGVQGSDQMCILAIGQEWVLSPDIGRVPGREAGDQEP